MRVISRRIGFYLITAIAAVTVDFFIPRVMPGNPVDAVLAKMQGQVITQATLRALELQFGSNTREGLWGQYLHYWSNLLHGNLGVSTSNGIVPVTTVIRGALPWTLGLVGHGHRAELRARHAARRPGGLAARHLAGQPAAGHHVLPGGTVLLPRLPGDRPVRHQAGLVPVRAAPGTASTSRPSNWAYISDVLDHAVLPALTIVVASAAGWIVGMRNVMVTTMDEDYVLIAQAKGLPKRRVVWYAARNAILPSISGFSLAIGFVVSGALLTEIVFSYPGLGLHPAQRRPGRRLRAAAGHLPGHHPGRAGRQPGRRLRLRVPRPAHPAGGLSDGHRYEHWSLRHAAPLQARHRRWLPAPGARPAAAGCRLPTVAQGPHRPGHAADRLPGPRRDRPWIAPYNPARELRPPRPASRSRRPRAHWLGTTQLQQDVFSQLLAGGRSTVLVAFVAGLVATVLSVVIGVTAGYIGGLADDLLSMLANIFLVLPALPLLIVIFGFLPSSQGGDDLLIGLIIAITGWAWGARVLRAQTLSLRNRDYVESARIIGERGWRIIGFEILPNLIPIVASSFLFTVLYGVGTYTALAFLGLVNPNHWSWGGMLFYAQVAGAEQSGYWWWFIPPGLAVALLGTALALLNFGIDEFINPRLRAGRRCPRRRARRQDGRHPAAPALRARRDPGRARSGRPR